MVKDMAGRMNALGRLHRLLSVGRAPGEVDLGEALSEVIEGFRTAGLFDDRLDVRLSVDGCGIDAAQASMLMLVAAEIITNAVKYAHPSGLPVALTIAATMEVSGDLILHIADDGVGLPEGFDEKRDAGPGLRLVRGLVENAGGRLTLHSDPLGLTFSIELPGSRQR
jgi:two-component sensor histidine kinase